MRDMTATIRAIEIAIGRTVSQWNKEDFIKFFETSVAVKRGSFIRTKVEFIANLKAMNLPNEEDVLAIVKELVSTDIPIDKNIELNYFFDHRELKYKFDMVVSSLAGDGSEDQYLYLKAAFGLAWIGVKLNDVVNVRIDDFNTDYSVLTYEGTKYQIPSEYVEDVKRLADLKSFVVNRGRRSAYTVENEGYLIRTSNSPRLTTQTLLARITDINTAYVKRMANKVFHYDKIFTSGILSRLLKEEERIGALYKVFEKGNIRMLKKEVFVEFLPKTGAVNSPMYFTDYVRLFDAYKRVYYKMLH